MRKSLLPVLICSCLLLTLSPHSGYAHHHHHHHHHYGGVALAWGLTGLVLGSSLAAFTYRPAPTVVYAPPPPVYRPPVYGYAPAIPPGYCRWERYVLDGYGRALLDGYGQPIKEYTIGSCQYPPN